MSYITTYTRKHFNPVHQEAEAVHIQVLPEQLMAEAEENSDNRCIKIKAYVHYEHTLVFIYPDV